MLSALVLERRDAEVPSLTANGSKIMCPRCGKVLGTREGLNVRIDKVGLLVIEAKSMPRRCGNCGYLVDMVKYIA